MQSENPSSTTTDGGGTASPTRKSPTSTPATGDEIEVSDIVVRKSVRYESLLGSSGVLAAADRQYVVASVRTTRDLSESDFAFVTDRGSWDPGLGDTAGGTNYAVAGHEGGSIGWDPGGDSAQSYLAFAIPSPLSASNPRIRYGADDSREWPLPAEERAHLDASSPSFELESLDVPETVSQGEPLSISLRARNVSEIEGRFLAAVYWPTNQIADDDESHIIDRVVGGGENLTASIDIDTSYTSYSDETVTLSVRGHVSAERAVQVQNASTPD